MIRWTRALAAVFLVIALMPTVSAAQAQTSVAGLGVRYAIPYEILEDTHDPGYGITWSSLADLGTMWASLSSGWTRFKGTAVEEAEGEPAETINQAELLFGMGLKLGGLWVGAKAGYFFRDQDEWDLLPTATLKLGTLVVTGEAKVLGDVRWYGAQLSWMSN